MTPVPAPALHMGSLHSFELVLFIALAVGPFVGLAVVVVVARRRDRAAGPDTSRPASRPAPPGSTNP